MQEYNEKEKILIIFSICFLHFYSNFGYENNFTFEDYFNQNLINLCTKYNVYVKDLKQFKIFSYSFYYQLIKEIKNIEYQKFKNMYNYYNYSTVEEEKIIIGEESSQSTGCSKSSANNFIKIFKNYIANFSYFDTYLNVKSSLKKIVNKKILTPLVSTTERVVDMVLSIDANTLNNSSTNSSSDEIDVERNSQNFNINISHSQAQEDVTMHDDTLPNQNLKQISKRILCELIKSDIDTQEKEVAYEISKKLDFLVEMILNKCENKIHFIQLFMCFIVEINSDLIRMLPQYNNLSEDLNMRFIIPSKNIYNFALEVYFSVNDLYNVHTIFILD